MTQLYVGNLSAEGDERAIKVLFGKYGIVREVLMKNGYAFVEYDSAYSAEEAIRALNGECACMFAATVVNVQLKLSKYKKKNQLPLQWSHVCTIDCVRTAIGEAFTCIYFDGRHSLSVCDDQMWERLTPAKAGRSYLS